MRPTISQTQRSCVELFRFAGPRLRVAYCGINATRETTWDAWYTQGGGVSRALGRSPGTLVKMIAARPSDLTVEALAEMNPITRLAQLKGTLQEQSRQSPIECPLIESSNADDQMHFGPFRQENCDTKKPGQRPLMVCDSVAQRMADCRSCRAAIRTVVLSKASSSFLRGPVGRRRIARGG